MKRIRRLVISSLVIYLMSCNYNPGTPSLNNSGGSSNTSNDQNPAPQSNSSSSSNSNTPPTSPPSNNNSGGGNSLKPINIPSSNKPAPGGILEQIGWGGKGGGEDGVPSDVEYPCYGCSVRLQKTSIRLSGFAPLQRLEIPIYRYESGTCLAGSADHVTTLSIQTDENGKYESALTGSTDELVLFAIYDADTGEGVWSTDITSKIEDYLDCPTYYTVTECAGAPPQRLEVNEMAYVCTAVDSVKLREGPGKNYPVIKSLVPGADIKIIGAAQCSDGWSWWQVETESGFEGWMSEGGDNTDPYFLCPR